MHRIQLITMNIDSWGTYSAAWRTSCRFFCTFWTKCSTRTTRPSFSLRLTTTLSTSKRLLSSTNKYFYMLSACSLFFCKSLCFFLKHFETSKFCLFTLNDSSNQILFKNCMFSNKTLDQRRWDCSFLKNYLLMFTTEKVNNCALNSHSP